jgi:hypothetical protein
VNKGLSLAKETLRININRNPRSCRTSWSKLKIYPRGNQQHPFLLVLLPLSANTSSHSLLPPNPQFCVPFLGRRLLLGPPSSAVRLLFILAPSLAPAFQLPESPYWIPLIGSSGSISPNSIFVNIILANLLNTSSTFSPERAETSTDTGTLADEAHLAASSAETSRPSGAIVALSCEPNPMAAVDVEATELPPLKGKEELLLLTLEGVVGGIEASIREPLPLARSALLPTRRVVRFGDARARASLRNAGRFWKVEWEVRS